MRVVRPRPARTSVEVPRAEMTPSVTATASATRDRESTVMTVPLCRMRSCLGMVSSTANLNHMQPGAESLRVRSFQIDSI